MVVRGVQPDGLAPASFAARAAVTGGAKTQARARPAAAEAQEHPYSSATSFTFSLSCTVWPGRQEAFCVTGAPRAAAAVASGSAGQNAARRTVRAEVSTDPSRVASGSVGACFAGVVLATPIPTQTAVNITARSALKGKDWIGDGTRRP